MPRLFACRRDQEPVTGTQLTTLRPTRVGPLSAAKSSKAADCALRTPTSVKPGSSDSTRTTTQTPVPLTVYVTSIWPRDAIGTKSNPPPGNALPPDSSSSNTRRQTVAVAMEMSVVRAIRGKTQPSAWWTIRTPNPTPSPAASTPAITKTTPLADSPVLPVPLSP